MLTSFLCPFALHLKDMHMQQHHWILPLRLQLPIFATIKLPVCSSPRRCCRQFSIRIHLFGKLSRPWPPSSTNPPPDTHFQLLLKTWTTSSVPVCGGRWEQRAIQQHQDLRDKLPTKAVCLHRQQYRSCSAGLQGLDGAVRRDKRTEVESLLGC
jgi:hypothetical protein